MFDRIATSRPGFRRVPACLGAAAFAGVLLAATSANAVFFPPTPMTDLSPYAVVSVGAQASLTINSGPITGAVLAGDGSTVSTSGGNNGSITGGAFADKTTLLSNFNGLQTKPTETLVNSSVTSDAFTEAGQLQAYLDGLTATQTLSSITGTATISDAGAVGAVSVIQFSSLQNATLTISGGASDYFVLRTSGVVNTNRLMTLSGGITADHIFWDLDGTSGNVLQTSGGDQLYGTFIDTKGGDFQFSELQLGGQLINTGGHIQFVSGSTMFADTFAPSIPEPAAWTLMILGFGGIGAILRRQRLSATA